MFKKKYSIASVCGNLNLKRQSFSPGIEMKDHPMPSAYAHVAFLQINKNY